MRTKRSGISPILATIILIAITIAGGLLVYNVFFSSSATAGKTAQVEIVSADITKSSTGTEVLVLQLQNAGNQPLTESSLVVLLDGAPPAIYNPPSGTLAPGGSLVLAISNGLPYNVGDDVSISVSVAGASGAAASQTSVIVSGSGPGLPSSSPLGSMVISSDWGGTDTTWDLGEGGSCNGAMTSIGASNGFPGTSVMQIAWSTGCSGDRAWMISGQQTSQFQPGHTYLITFWYRSNGKFNVNDRDMTIVTLNANTGSAIPVAITYTATSAYHPGGDDTLFWFGSGGTGDGGYDASYFQITQIAIQQTTAIQQIT